MYRLSNWTILYCKTRNGGAVMRLRGEVFGNPRYTAGEEITISTLCSCRQDGDTILVTTRSGSEYELGKPNPDEPEAIQRVLRQLQAQDPARTDDAASTQRTKP
jgi:hypothetical protein